VVAVIAGAVAATAPSPSLADAPTPDARIASAFAAGDCARCHEVPVAGVVVAARLDNCKSCHIWIREVSADPVKRAKAVQVFPMWPRYEKTVRTYLKTPPLDAAMARLDPEWVRTYLQDPHDLRPNLPETMPRFALGDDAIDAIVDAFAAARITAPPTPKPDAANLARGEALFASSGCDACHTFGARHVGGVDPMAPDLANARARMAPDAIVAWIRDPKAISTGATMPALGLSEADAIALRDYLVLADPLSKPAPALGAPPVATKDPVTWSQVEERVTGRICQHCHMNPALNQGRAGPGNAGGFGWPATGIELQTYEGVVAVKDRIPDALMRRRTEAHRDVVHPGEHAPSVVRPEVPGMPLGLPALSDEDISLVLGWIEQGCPK
jgi:mono/diheme cytochrome c family protein